MVTPNLLTCLQAARRAALAHDYVAVLTALHQAEALVTAQEPKPFDPTRPYHLAGVMFGIAVYANDADGAKWGSRDVPSIRQTE